MDNEDLGSVVLGHSGVKGMKWGVRHDPGHAGEREKTKKIAKLDTKFEKEIANGNAGKSMRLDVRNSAVARINRNIEAVSSQNKYRNKDLSNLSGQLRKDYDKETTTAVNRAMEDTIREHYGSNASGTKRAVYNSKTDRVDIIDRVAAHAAALISGPVPDMTVHLVRDKTGHVVSTDVTLLNENPSVMQGEDFSSFVLSHHGVKGMKWGVRKSRSLGSTVVTAAKASTPNARKATKEAVVADRNKHASPDHKEVQRKLEKANTHGTSALTNADLKKVNERLNLERNFSQLTTAQKSAGRKQAEQFLVNEGSTQVKNLGKKHVAKLVAKNVAKKAAIAALV